LRLGVKAANGIQRGAEEIQPERLLLTRRPQINNAAAQGKSPGSRTVPART